jgi:hypothetical protein
LDSLSQQFSSTAIRKFYCVDYLFSWEIRNCRDLFQFSDKMIFR